MFANPLLFGFSVAFGIVGALILFNRWEKQAWEHYFSELVASVVVLTATLGLILFVSGTATLEHSRSGTVPLGNTDVIFLVIYLSFGLLLANIRVVSPVLKSGAVALISAFRCRFVPPYSELDVKVNGMSRPPIDDIDSAIYPLRVCIFSAASVLVLASVVLWMGNFGDFIRGHLNLIGYFRDVISGDPEKILDGSMGALEEVVRILDLQVLFVYLLILVLSYAYAASAIYFTRLGMERIRQRLGISWLNMIALTVLVSMFLLVVSGRIADHLLLIARSIISVELAALN